MCNLIDLLVVQACFLCFRLLFPFLIMSSWVEATDPSTKKVYYYNKETKKTQWTRPTELDT